MYAFTKLIWKEEKSSIIYILATWRRNHINKEDPSIIYPCNKPTFRRCLLPDTILSLHCKHSEIDCDRNSTHFSFHLMTRFAPNSLVRQKERTRGGGRGGGRRKEGPTGAVDPTIPTRSGMSDARNYHIMWLICYTIIINWYFCRFLK